MALRDILVHFGVTVDQTQMIDAQRNVSKLISQFNGLARVAQFALGALSVKGLTDSFDTFVEVENRLRAATKSTEEFAAAQKAVFDIARQTATPIESVTEQFQRYSLATENLGKSQEEVLDFTKRVNQATKLGGATNQETRGALIQLAQGLGTDFKAAGQEIRSIQKSAPLLASIIAKAAGGSASELTALAKAGKLTSKLVFEAVREAGDQIDKEFAKRKLRFEDISTLFGVEWMALIKQLEPAFTAIIAQLTELVKWTREWVEDGSAMNAFIAAAITGVGILTGMFAGLLVQVLALAAPFVALFLLVDDFVTFLRGGESVIGDMLGENSDKVREELTKLTEALGGFLKAFGSGNDAAAQSFADLFASRFETAMKVAIDSVLRYATEKLFGLFGLDQKADGPKQLTGDQLIQQGVDRENQGIFRRGLDWVLGGDELRAEVLKKRLENGWTPDQAGVVGPTVPEIAPAPWNPVGAAPGPGPEYGPPAPVSITNQVTVNGNATSETAREIATESGKATAASLGRSRDAIGASLGMSQ